MAYVELRRLGAVLRFCAPALVLGVWGSIALGCGEEGTDTHPIVGDHDPSTAGTVGEAGSGGMWDPEPGAGTGGTGGTGGTNEAGAGGTGGIVTHPTAGEGGVGGAGQDGAGTGGTEAGHGGDGGSDSPAPGVGMQPSSGCGAANAPASGEQRIRVSGTDRSYIVGLPRNYDRNRPYRLILAWHGMTGTAQQIASRGYYGLANRSGDSAIFVAPQGLGNPTGWANAGGQDVNFMQALITHLRSNYCVDENRIFGTGMSYGGIMSNIAGCQMGDIFRAVAPMASSSATMGRNCAGQVAVWIAHGTSDTFPGVSYTNGVTARDRWVAANGCSTNQPTNVAPSPCVAYRGCDEGYPVHWCAFNGAHVVPSFAGEGIWNFFSQF